MDALADLLCDEDSVPELCGSVLFLLCGFDSAQLNMTLLDTIVHHTPAGASSKTLVHYAQEMSSRKHIRVKKMYLKNLFFVHTHAISKIKSLFLNFQIMTTSFVCTILGKGKTERGMGKIHPQYIVSKK